MLLLRSGTLHALRLSPLITAVLLVCGLAPSPAAAQIFVDVDAQGAGDGSSWADAFQDLQDALAVASDGDEIWVAAGTYFPTSGSDRAATFQLRNEVAVYGGFAGTEKTRTERDWTLHPTVLSGDIGAPGDFYDNSYHVVTGSGTGAVAVLDGFTVTGGYASYYPAEINGAGMYILTGHPTLVNLIFLDNFAEGYGGGLYNQSSDPTLTNVTFRGNTGLWSGGGLYNENSNPTLIDVVFAGNTGLEFGGGMCNSASSPTLTRVTFDYCLAAFTAEIARKGISAPENQAYNGGGLANLNGSNPILTDVLIVNCWASDFGGGIYNEASNPTLHRVSIMYNGNGSGDGGGFCNWSGNPSLTDVTFNSNLASWSGGGMSSRGNPTLVNVTFIDNRCFETPFLSGGGGFSNQGDAVLTNVAFIQNISDHHGGGMFSYSGNPILTNVTFAGNSAGENGGALANYGGSPVLTNSILWDNQSDLAGSEIYNDATVPQISYSLIEGSGGSGPGWDASLGSDLGHNLDADPLFVDAAAGNVRLNPTSPAVGTGDNAAIPAGVTTDLDGNPRIRGTTVDLGAYECQTGDETPPSLSVVLSRTCLWPPNHRMVGIHAVIAVDDAIDPAPTFVLTSITSDEPDTSGEEGNLPEDVQGADFGTADLDFALRSERSALGDGRTYIVTYTATDASGNAVAAVAMVLVPRDLPGTALAATGYLPDGTGFLPKASTFSLVIPSPRLSSGGAGPMFDPGKAEVGNHLAIIPALSYRVLDVTGDGVDDLVLEYPTATTLQLAEMSGPEDEPVAFRYECPSPVGRLIPDIFALGEPVTVPAPSGTPDHAGDKTLTPAVEGSSPVGTGFSSIRPNPFRGSTRVAFHLPAAGPVRLDVFDLRGACVRTLLRGATLEQGVHQVTWDGLDDAGRPASTGVYFFRLIGEGIVQTRKATMMR